MRCNKCFMKINKRYTKLEFVNILGIFKYNRRKMIFCNVECLTCYLNEQEREQ